MIPEGYQSDLAWDVEPIAERPFSDDGNAYRLIDVHGDQLRYLPGGGWYVWDGTRWAHDTNGEATRRARDIAERLRAEARAVGDREDDFAKALRHHAKATASRRGIEAMIALAKTDARVLVSADTLDADAFALNTSNGTVDLRTGERRDHARADLITRRTAVAYDPDAKAPTWDAFLARVLPDSDIRRYVQLMAGASAVGHNADELVHVLHGGGGNGKTKFAETIRAALGDYAATAAAELFIARPFGPSAQPELVRLRGVRLLTASETEEGSQLNVALVKALTGGDAIAARRLYANEVVEFVPVFSPWLRTNHRPAIREQSEAVWRRVRLVPFTVTIPRTERDTALQGRLYTELAGVLRWIIEGAAAYLRDGLEPPASVTAATDAYREEEDILGAFIADRCLAADDCAAAPRELYAAWESWAKEHGEKPGTSTSFGRALTDAGYPAGRDRRGNRVRLGIALRGPLDDEGDRQ